MAYALLAISAIAFAGLIVCAVNLFMPIISWKHTHNPIQPQFTVHIPRAGNYSARVIRDRFWLFKKYGTLSDMFPNVLLSIQKTATGEFIQYTKRRSMMVTKRVEKMTVLAGNFIIISPGEYLITILQGSTFLEKDELYIRRCLGTGKMVLFITGVILSFHIFILCLVFGILIATGNISTSGIMPFS